MNKSSTEYILLVRMEEDFWKQKAAIKWTVEGKRNTKFFHGWVKQKRTKSRIHVIKEGRREINEDSEIRASASTFFKDLLTSEGEPNSQPDLSILQKLPEDTNLEDLCAIPTANEVREAVWSIDECSTPGPDGFSSKFFQSCWSIVGADVLAAVTSFFEGSFMPRSFTSTMLILLPKKDKPESWSDYRPISLCNVTNKIISKILAVRLAPLLPTVIAPNQSSFIKGRLISDNALLAQELIHDLHRHHPSPNVALKLDMAKAYDRVQWPFLLKVLQQMGFPSKWVDLINRSISCCWFSVLINGTPDGFFQSSRGLRQGNPLSPGLFMLAADYLSRLLDKLIIGDKTMRYGVGRNSISISHLSYADDLLIFTQASSEAQAKLGHCIRHYEEVSGQKINAAKSNFYIHDKHSAWAASIRQIGGFNRGTFPFLYLGVPLYRGVKKNELFWFFRDKITSRILSWSHRHLLFGGRLLLIKSTLKSIPLHVFQVLEPTAAALHRLEQVLAPFFWGSSNDAKKTHWIKWLDCCRPFAEGGLGIRRFQDTVQAFSFKLWWRFREKQSLWAEFMAAKYCFWSTPLEVSPSRRHSPIWRRIFQAGQKIHQFMRWSLGEGKIGFWDDTWLEDVPLWELATVDATANKTLVCDFWNGDKWDQNKLHTALI